MTRHDDAPLWAERILSGHIKCRCKNCSPEIHSPEDEEHIGEWCYTTKSGRPRVNQFFTPGLNGPKWEEPDCILTLAKREIDDQT